MNAPIDVDTELDQQTIDELVPPCDVTEAESGKCPHVAKWIATVQCTGCGRTRINLLCDRHILIAGMGMAAIHGREPLRLLRIERL